MHNVGMRPMQHSTHTPSGDSRRKESLMPSIFTFTYRVASGATQSFRCAAGSREQAIALWSEERDIVRKVTSGPITLTSVNVA